MCGRFESKPSINSLSKKLKQHNVDLKIEFEPESSKTANIAPTNKIFSVRYADENYRLFQTNWGIKFSPNSPLIFNSRIETIKEKKYWMNLFSNQRSLIPMSAFYEWKKEGTKKTPCRIFLPDEEVFFVPALNYVDKEKNNFTSLITTTPNSFMKNIHHRMPVILRIEEGLNFLLDDPETNLTRCVPYTGKMELEPASI